MIVPDFTIFTESYISNTPRPVFSALIERGARDNVYKTANHDKLFRHLSILKEETVIAEQFKQNKHNFDAIFEQIDVENMKWFSFFWAFDFCRNLAAVQSTLTYCYEQTASKHTFEKATLQFTLSFYNTENLNGNVDTQTVASYIGVKAAARRDKDLQEPVRLKKEEPEQNLPFSSEELEDVFMRKESSSYDAFATEDFSSSTKRLE
ncbi:TrwN protein [Bartonella sp. AU55XJBT]|uniref:TrwN protein n=1 Tax=Bartonella sp. AU55XJBT TaxID=3019091 RepID=UPI00235E11C6|nr:TrwN protein [Bartonella sp. AU55XJBT]